MLQEDLRYDLRVLLIFCLLAYELRPFDVLDTNTPILIAQARRNIW